MLSPSEQLTSPSPKLILALRRGLPSRKAPGDATSAPTPFVLSFTWFPFWLPEVVKSADRDVFQDVKDLGGQAADLAQERPARGHGEGKRLEGIGRPEGLDVDAELTFGSPCW